MGSGGSRTGAPDEGSSLRCVPGGIPPEHRPGHFARIERLFRGAAPTHEAEPGGYRFRFPAEELEEVARFVALERKCCPFLSFSIEVGPEDGPVFLRVSGPPGARELIEAELLR